MMRNAKLPPKTRVPAQAAIDFAATVENIDSAVAVSSHFQGYIEAMGFSSAVCLKIDRRRQLVPDDILMCTRPRPWFDCYMQEGQMAVDPVLAALGEAWRPFAWSDVVDPARLDQAAREVMGLAAEYGMHDGFVIPISDSYQPTGLVSIAGPRRRLAREERAVLTLVAVHIHQRLVTLHRKKASTPVLLSARELEIVRWIAEGKSDWQIGQILEISAKTVNYHVENVKRKFGVASRIQAVVAALNDGRLSH